MTEYFREAGYRTFFAGKWHLGGEGFYPEDQGFEINKGGFEKGQPPNGYYVPYKNPKLPDGPQGEYLTDRLTDETIHFIENNKNDPFFAFLSFYTVHTPIEASMEDRPQYGNLNIPNITFPEGDAHTLLFQNNLDYASMVTAMDRNVGKLINALKRMGQWENTVFLFSSDNGGLSTLFRTQGIPTSNRPKRAGKGWCYEGGIRVPQIIHIPGQTPHINRIDVPTVHQDLLPTLWEAAGLPANSLAFNIIDGKSVINGSSRDRILFWDYPHYHGSGWTPGAAIRQGEWKLIHWYEHDKVELYNLKTDPGESVDLSEKLPLITKSMLSKLNEEIKENSGQYPRPNSAYNSENNNR